MTTEQKNKEVCQWLGICWHEPVLPQRESTLVCRHCGYKKHLLANIEWHPDFSQSAGIIRLLEEMVKRGDCGMFVAELNGEKDKDYTFIDNPIPTNFLTTPGKLLQAVWEWSKEHPNSK